MIIQFICEGCGSKYDNYIECVECEAREPAIKLKVGDIVLARCGFGWYDGDVRWIKNPGVRDKPKHSRTENCFGACCTYSFYYVVTHIDAEKHRARYHLFTKAMTPEAGYHSGYTYNVDHFTPRKVKNPPKRIVEDSKDLIGQMTTHLL